MLGPGRRLAGRRRAGPLGRCLDLRWGLFLPALPSSPDAALPLAAKAFDRLQACGPGGHRIPSNPIFARVMREGRR